MKRNVGIVCTLLVLAVVPVTCTFLFSGENEDGVERPPEPVASAADASASDAGGPAPGTESAPIDLKDADKAVGVPVFKGFEKPRYQQYDALIRKFVEDFNRKPAAWAGGTSGQGAGIPRITAAQVKAHIIQETGGGDSRSRAAWARDPLQVNVPGDWNPYKKYLGLKEPRRCNEGSGEKNLKAGLMLLVRKGFGVSGQPAGNRPDGSFDGWARALQRYNGRSDKAASGKPYSEAYSERIRQRAEHPGEEVPIPIPTKKK